MATKDLINISAPAHEWLQHIVDNCKSLSELGEQPITNLQFHNGLVFIDVELVSTDEKNKRNKEDKSFDQMAKNWIANCLDELSPLLDTEPTLYYTLDNAILSFKLMEIKGHFKRATVNLKIN